MDLIDATVIGLVGMFLLILDNKAAGGFFIGMATYQMLFTDLGLTIF
jgi:hypothetical protein